MSLSQKKNKTKHKTTTTTFFPGEQATFEEDLINIYI